MKSGNKEVRLVYRKLSDPFFIINKPVNWTLKEKIGKHKKNTECLKCYKSVKKETEAYKNVLKKLSLVEKNAFLYTNSTSLCYNNLRLSLNQNGSNETENKKKNEKGDILEKNGNNNYLECYYVESLLKNETDKTLFYPYKLPLYMSGLIICCSDYFIYQRFLHLIKENKMIQKYRCLINNPLYVFNNHKHMFAINNGNSKYYGSLRSKISKINDSELKTNDKFQNESEKKTGKKKNKEEKTFEDIEMKMHIKKYKRYINELTTLKKVNDLFPYHNFYDNNSVSKNYWNNITDLEINKWKQKIDLLMKQKNKESHINSPLGRKKKTTQHPLDIYEEKRKRQLFEVDHFIQVFLKKSEPVKSLNTLFPYIFGYDNCNDFFAWKKKSAKQNYDPQKKTEKLEFLLSDLHKINFQKMWNLHKNKIKPPLSSFFNEGTFYRLEEKNQINSYSYSMIYKMYNYKDYLQKEKLWKAEKNEKGVTSFENLLLIEFILLDRIKPDMIRFFFSEMKTPIINDNIFDKTNFKKDIINQAILESERNEEGIDSAIDIFGNACTQYNEKTFNKSTHNNDDEDKHNDYTKNAFKSDIKTFSIPYNNNDTFNNTQGQHKIQLNNYFVHESENYENIPDSYEKDNNIKTNNICLELYQLQFCDPITDEYVKIENSLPSGWF